MPDVGTLNLTIESNANVAASGLVELADALERVQQAVGTGLKLSNASRSLNSFAKAVSENSKALSNVGTFLTAITNYTKAFKDAEKVKFNAKPIEDLKNAIGEGIKIGQAGTQINKLREALGGDWNIDNAKKAGDAMTLIADGAKTFVGTNLGTIAKNVSAVGKALAEYADGAERIKSVIGNQSTSSSDIIGNSGFAPGRMKLNLQQFGEGGSGDGSLDIKNFTSKQSEIQSAVSAYGEIADQFTKVNETVQTALNDDPILRMSFSIGSIGQSAQTTVPLIDLLQKDLEKLEQKAAKIAERFAGFGGDPMNSEAFRSAEKRIISLTEKIENLTALNPNATKPESNGIASITKGLVDTSDLDLWKNKIEAHIDDVVDRYNKGKLSVEQFNAEIMKIRKDQGKFLEVSAQAKAAEIVASKMEELSNATGDSVSKVELLGKKLAWLRQQLEERKLVTQFLGIDQNTDQTLLSLQGQIVSVTGQMEKLEAAEQKVKEAAQFDAMKESADNLQRSYGGEMVSNLVENYSQIDLLQLKLSGMKQALADDINQNKIDTQQIAERVMAIQSLAEKIKDLQDAEESATSWTQRFRDSFSELKDSVKKLFPSITNLLKRFQSIAKMRALRYVVREIAKGFSEGIKNLYQYSKEVGTSFAPAMDSAATALMQMKNSIAAAVAPAIQAVIPILKQVVSWFITGINYVNQFFALLRGQSTWTEAIEYSTEAYEDNTNAAQSAAKAAKDLLADWDELNIIQSENGGGGGGRVGKEEPDYAAMFHEVGQFDQWILDIVHGIEDTFGSVLGLVKRIGAIIFGWKVASAFAGVIGTLGALIATAGIIDIVFNLSSMFDNKYFDTGDVGWLLANVLTTFIGGVLTNRILQTVLKGEAGHIGIPLVFAVSALADIVTLIGRNDVSGLSKEGLTVSIMSALKMGTAAAYLSKTILHNSLGQSLLGGAAIAAITLGAVVGIKAIAEAVDGGKGVTPETVEQAALSSLSMGIGTAMLAKLTGASVLVAAGTGAAAAILTLTAVIGIAALLSLAKDVPQPVQWGDYHATEQQIKEYVEEKVFKVSPQAILSIVDPMIEVNTRNQQELTASVNKVRLDVKKLEIGINDEDSTLKDLEKLVFGDTETGTTGLIGKFKETASGYQNIIETGITLVPSVSNEDGTPKEIIDKSSEGWTYLTNHMESLGSELEKHFFNAYKKDITTDAKEAELKTIQELTSMVANVSAAISRGQASEEALQSLSENIMNMDEDSFSGLFDYIDEYKKQVVDAYTKTYDEVTRTLAGQKAGLIQAIENENILAGESKTTEERNGHLALAKEYEDQLKWLDDYLAQRKEGRQEAIDKVAEDAMNDDVIDEIKRALASRINKNALDDSLAGQILDIQNNDFSYKLWEQLFSTKGKTSKNAKTIVENWLNQMIDAGYAGNADIIREALSKGYIGYGDLITNEMIDYLGESIGIGHQSKKVQSAWNKLINEIFENDKDHKYKFTFEVEPNPVVDAAETVKEVSEQTKKNLESTQGYILGDDITAEEAMEYVNKPVERAKQEIEQNAIEMPGIDSSEIDEGFDNITENAEETVEEIKDLFGELQNLIFESNVFDKTNYREKAQELYSSNNIEEMKRLINYIKEFGLEEGYKQFVNSGKGTNMLNRGGSNPLAQTLDASGYARAGVPQNGGDQKSEPTMDYSQMANSVQQGTTQANTPMVNQLGSIIDQLTRLLNKQWVVNVEPTTTFGRTVNQSQTAYGNVTGDAPIFG